MTDKPTISIITDESLVAITVGRTAAAAYTKSGRCIAHLSTRGIADNTFTF